MQLGQFLGTWVSTTSISWARNQDWQPKGPNYQPGRRNKKASKNPDGITDAKDSNGVMMLGIVIKVRFEVVAKHSKN